MSTRKPHSTCIHFCILTFLILVLGPTGSTTHAQDLDTITITGRVTDENKAIVPGASVTAVLTGKRFERATETNDEGRYQLIQLEPGVYSLRISAAGFATQEKKDLAVSAGRNIQCDVVLTPQGVIVDPIVVTAADMPPVDTTRTVVGGSLMAQDVELLPSNTRAPLDLIFTLPGVSEEPLSTRDLAEDRNTNAAPTPEEAGNFSLSGGPAYSNNLTIEGLDNNDDRSAKERFQPSIEAVAEVQVITNQFSAEYGRASGGRVNLRTRSGSNEFHGRAFYFFRDEALNANTFRNNSLGISRLPLQEHVGGFTFGGPVKLKRRDLNALFFT